MKISTWILTALFRCLRVKLLNFKPKNYFTEEELACKCGCGGGWFNHEALDKFNIARYIANIPFDPSSAIRCFAYNKTVKGVKDSTHMYGVAMDLTVTNSTDRFKIIFALLLAGFTRIGIAKTFVHADNSDKKSSGVIWLY